MMVGRGGTARATAPDWSRDLPLQIGPWQGRDLPTDEAVREYLAADTMLQRLYRRGERSLLVSAVFGNQWRSLHSPAGCYPSQGWQTVERRAAEVPAQGPLPHPGPLHAEELLVKRGEVHRLVLYLYAHPGGTTASWVEQCLKVARGGAAGGIVAIVDGECTPETRTATEADAFDLLARVYPYLVKDWYDA